MKENVRFGIHLPVFGNYLNDGIDIIAIFGDKRNRFPRFFDYMAERAIREFEADPKDNILPMQFHQQSFSYVVDWFWMMHVLTDWIAEENRLKREEIEPYITHYLVATSAQYASIARFFVVGLLAEYFGVLSTKITLTTADYNVPKNSISYEKVGYYIPVLYWFESQKRYVTYNQIAFDSHKIDNLLEDSFTDYFAKIQAVGGFRQVAFGYKNVQKTIGDQKAWRPYIFRFGEAE